MAESSKNRPAVPVWTWRDAIRKTPVPPLTKHICNCIANYVSDVGKGAFPSVRQLIDDSGMSNKSVAAHLQNAVDAGLLEIEREKGKDGRFGRSTYYPRFPDDMVLKRRADRVIDADEADDQVNELHAASPSEGDTRGDADDDADQVNELHTDRPSEAASPGPSEPPSRHQVKELHSKRTIQVELSTHTPNPSLPERPPDVCVGGGKPVDPVLIELGQAEQGRHVVESYIRPLWGALRLPGGVEAVPFLAGIRDALAVVEPEVLERAALITQRTRTVWPSPAQAYKLANEAAVDVPLKRFEREHPAFRGWLAHYRATGRGFWARECEARGYVLERSAVPPVGTPKPGKAA